jgi:hypothetical protein
VVLSRVHFQASALKVGEMKKPENMRGRTGNEEKREMRRRIVILNANDAAER